MQPELLRLTSPCNLSGGILSGATALCVRSGGDFPTDLSGTFRVLIDSEIKRLRGASGFVYSIVEAGAEGTTEADHQDYASVTHLPTPLGIKNVTGSVNAQTDTSYTISALDARALVTLNNGSAVAVTLPQATSADTSDFGPHFWFDLLNLGAGVVTITPTTSTINGLASITVAFRQGVRVYSDGTNYFAIQAGALASGAVQSGHIASGAVQGFFGATRHIASGTVGVFDFGSGAVVAGTVGSGAIQSGNIASGQIGNSHLTANTVRSGHIGSGAVVGQAGGGNFNVASGTLTFNDLGSGAIRSGTIASGQIGVGHLQSGMVTSGLHLSGSIGSGQIGRFHIASGRLDGFELGSGSIVSGRIASGQVGNMHLAADTVRSGHVASGAVIGHAGGGNFNIGSGTIGTNDIGSGAIVSGLVASGQLGRFHIASGQLAGFELGSGAIVSGRVASGQIGFGHLANASVRSGTLASGQNYWPHHASGYIIGQSGILVDHTAAPPTVGITVSVGGGSFGILQYVKVIVVGGGI